MEGPAISVTAWCLSWQTSYNEHWFIRSGGEACSLFLYSRFLKRKTTVQNNVQYLHCRSRTHSIQLRAHVNEQFSNCCCTGVKQATVYIKRCSPTDTVPQPLWKDCIWCQRRPHLDRGGVQLSLCIPSLSLNSSNSGLARICCPVINRFVCIFPAKRDIGWEVNITANEISYCIYCIFPIWRATEEFLPVKWNKFLRLWQQEDALKKHPLNSSSLGRKDGHDVIVFSKHTATIELCLMIKYKKQRETDNSAEKEAMHGMIDN